jgi:hypothetical protein
MTLFTIKKSQNTSHINKALVTPSHFQSTRASLLLHGFNRTRTMNRSGRTNRQGILTIIIEHAVSEELYERDTAANLAAQIWLLFYTTEPNSTYEFVVI